MCVVWGQIWASGRGMGARASHPEAFARYFTFVSNIMIMMCALHDDYARSSFVFGS